MRLRRLPPAPGTSGVLAVLVAAVAGMACGTIKLVGDYDEQIDAGVTALQRSTETFLVKIASVSGAKVDAYENNKGFYGEARIAISSLRVRADAIERNSLTVKMLDLLQRNLDRFERDHASPKGIDKRELPTYRGGFNSQFTAILTFELAKKRGATPDASRAEAGATPPPEPPEQR